MSQQRYRAAVVFNEPVLPLDHPDSVSERDVVDVASGVAAALRSQNWEAVEIAAAPPIERLLAQLDEARPDVVFNLLEGFAGRSTGEIHATSLFELLGLPYTGADVAAQAACLSKSRAKCLLRGAGLPTAPWHVLAPGETPSNGPLDFPILVKPDAEDGSLGIDQSSVVDRPEHLAERVERLRVRYGGNVLLERYLPGTEFNVGVLALPEPRALPVAQVVYHAESGFWPILTYAAKWDPNSAEDRASVIACPAPIAQPLAEELAAIAVRAVRVVGCRDYARVDLRLDGEGRPMILEVNPNPDLGRSAGLARAIGVAGLDYDAVVAAIARTAINRSRPPGAGREAPSQSSADTSVSWRE